MQFSRTMVVRSLVVLVVLPGLLGAEGCPGDTPPETPDPPPVPDPAPPAPDPEPPMPDPGRPDPGPVNVYTDSYDPVGDRMVVGHCPRSALVAIDRTSGAEDVLVAGPQWPFEDQGSVCPLQLGRQADNQHIFAVVSHSYPDPTDPEVGCRSRKLVDIPAQGPPSLVKILYLECCDDCGGSESYQAVLLDDVHDRLVLLEDDCNSNGECDNDLIAYDRESLTFSQVYRINEGGGPRPEPRGEDLIFDSRAPDSSVFALIRGRDSVDVIDVDTSEQSEFAAIQTTWETLPATVDPYAIRLDVAGNKLHVIGRVQTIGGGHVVIGIDIETRAQELVYDGSPTGQDERVDCFPQQVAFDSMRNQMLWFVNPSSRCTEGLFAADLETGTLTREPYTPAAAQQVR